VGQLAFPVLLFRELELTPSADAGKTEIMRTGHDLRFLAGVDNGIYSPRAMRNNGHFSCIDEQDS
jgi:hypothetical protein